MRTDDRVVVIGAGLTGLVTAYELHQRGIPTLVLERGPVAGGRIGTVELAGGLRAESHLEELWASSPAYELLRTLGLPLVEHPAASSFVADDQLHLIADDGRCSFVGAGWPADVRRSFEHWNATARLVASEVDERRLGGPWTERLQSVARTDLRSFVDGLGLSRAVSTWLRLNVESETGVEWDRISTLDGIDDLRPFLVDDDGRPLDRGYRIAGGNDRLVDALVERLPIGTVRFDAAVHRVVDDGSGVVVHHRTATGEQRAVRGSYAVLTPPVWALAGIDIHPALDARARAAIASISAGSYVKVVMHVRDDGTHLWDRFGGRPLTLLSDSPAGCVYLGDRGSTGQGAVLTALVYGWNARVLHGLDAPSVASQVLIALESLAPRCATEAPLFPALSRSIDDVRVFDCPRAVAHWPHAAGRSRFDELAAALSKPGGRVLIGGDTTDSSHSDGAMRAARRMVDWISAREQVAAPSHRSVV